MFEIGKYNELKVFSKTEIGLYLGDGQDNVLLPNRYMPPDVAIGDMLEVFVYLDNEDRPVATTLKPYATLDEFAFLKVKEVNQFGAFLDWGVSKDLFVPYAEQRTPLERGDEVIVYVFKDEFSGRIAATTKWNKFLEDTSDLKVEQEVQLLIAERTDLGFRAIINNTMEGILFHNEIFEDIRPGEIKRGYVKNVRPDGKVDLRLQQTGYKHIEESKFVLLKHLKDNAGYLPLGDKSSSEEIYRQLRMSKKAFKKAVGGLFKDRLITISDTGIKLATREG
ncbi:MAG TPA: S1-like domain-containing RNA-binding protein [Saprospiraceae bacterium]|nr:S1-like domain-containing RNA-binding protein [Saprospiraceae bacterium]